MKLLTLILQVLNWLFSQFERSEKQRKQRERDEQKQQAQDDPHGWFDDHFNGDANRVRGDETDARTDGVRTDANKAGKAKPTQPDENG